MTATSMKKFIGSIKRSSKSQAHDKSTNGSFSQQTIPEGDSPEAVAVREVIAFCEAGAPGAASAGEEYLHLPSIVDAAESSPSAAREAAACIQRLLSKQNFHRGFAQYNAIMLLRILTDNPGRVFTQNFDKSFVSTVKSLLRDTRDASVQQIMRETLDYFEVEKLNGNDTLMPLIEMWRKEKGGSARMYANSNLQSTSRNAPLLQQRSSHRERGLPPPEEIAARVEESKTSARLLVQMVQSTPPNELLGNELIKEFAERARQAHKSVQNYMGCENPAPDEHTMLTLIETSEQLNIAMSKHQRAVLAARRTTGSAQSSPQPQPNAQDPFSTTQMQNALPPQPAARPQQHRQEQHDYNQQYHNYGQTPMNIHSSAIVRPGEQDEHSFMPPPGPPPRTVENQVPAPALPSQPYHNYEPVSPPRRNDHSSYPTAAPISPTATRDYDIADNPFSDDAYSADPTPHQRYQHQSPQQTYQSYQAPPGPPPQQNASTLPYQVDQQSNNSYSLFNRAAGQLRSPNSPPLGSNSERPGTNELDASSYPPIPPTQSRDSDNRPGPHSYNSGWQPTPSYIHRQESSEAHVTMHGASPGRR
ncbi:hypothetical protein H2198_001207 [Neophaeococcomyces mojaviensis]|uniref:Uncharacterized protein n=1 Tax=Neophaeococcomyces mojaviensis TaxID=3383035 RepID=A0ACC3AI76_9EURO|nr:hypothetical protein H2198_001207 [Knufia sp. JES_112]